MTKAHTGHLGIVKTKARAREAMWRPGMNADLEKWVSNCQACTIHQNQQRSEPLLSLGGLGNLKQATAHDQRKGARSYSLEMQFLCGTLTPVIGKGQWGKGHTRYLHRPASCFVETATSSYFDLPGGRYQ